MLPILDDGIACGMSARYVFCPTISRVHQAPNAVVIKAFVDRRELVRRNIYTVRMEFYYLLGMALGHGQQQDSVVCVPGPVRECAVVDETIAGGFSWR